MECSPTLTNLNSIFENLWAQKNINVFITFMDTKNEIQIYTYNPFQNGDKLEKNSNPNKTFYNKMKDLKG